MTSAPPPTPPPTDQPAWDEPSPPPGRPARPELRRSGTDKMIGGVAGGLAEHTGIDSVLWRVGFVALTLAGGSGILVYLLLWVLMAPPSLGPEDRPGPLEPLAERLHTAVSGLGTAPGRD